MTTIAQVDIDLQMASKGCDALMPACLICLLEILETKSHRWSLLVLSLTDLCNS